MKKKMLNMFLLMTMLLSLFAACGKEKRENEFTVYYLNPDITTLVPCEVKLEHTNGSERIKELLGELQTQPTDAGMRQTIPSDISVLGVDVGTYQISVDFSASYNDLEPIEEILTRAAIVKTLIQNTDYLYVMFTVEGEPLTNDNGITVGAMGLDSFVENPGQQISSSQTANLTLYFSNAEGNALIAETREVRYSSNTSMDKLVLEQLLDGPKESGLLATIPSGTRLITISTVDGVCYVNLDETFANQNQEISEQVVLYSIVDSLTELQTIDKVQISINGDTKGKVRYTYDLSTMYEEDPSLITTLPVEEGIESTE